MPAPEQRLHVCLSVCHFSHDLHSGANSAELLDGGECPRSACQYTEANHCVHCYRTLHDVVFAIKMSIGCCSRGPDIEILVFPVT